MRVDPRNVGPLYRVKCTEYEDGVQRDMGEVFFTTEEEARLYCEQYASGDRGCYYRAEYRRIL